MSTWNVITITGAPRLTDRKLDKTIGRSGLDLHDQDVSEDSAGTWTISGHSKYEAEGIYWLAEDVSQRHPGSRVEVSQEWDTRDADEQGQTIDIYIDGERREDSGQMNGLVPVDLSKSIDAVRAALGGSGDLTAAALWLVDGLDGTR